MITSFFHICSNEVLLVGVVDVVDQFLDHAGGVGSLGTLAVVSDHSASGSADDDGALLALL